MRPLRLDMEGFGTFREATTVDLSDTDFFALVGPTGSGKTTVIDAMCFALYGTVARWPRAKQVSLALAPSASDARVSLVFDVAGRRHAVVRALGRARNGQVSTKEARLDLLPGGGGLDGDIGEVLDQATVTLAYGEGVEAKVAELLGLSWEHFIQCVVLPQGDFATFLHATPGERQKLLVSLLGLDVYGQVGRAARGRAEEAKVRASWIAAHLADFADATQEAEDAAAARVHALQGLENALLERLGSLTEAEERLVKVRDARDAVGGEIRRLAALRTPAGLDALAERQRRAEQAVVAAWETVTRAEQSEIEAQQVVTRSGDPAEWRASIGAHEQAAELDRRITGQAAELATAEQRLAQAATALTRAESDARTAGDRFEQARRDFAVTVLAPSLTVGVGCPVCIRPIEVLPEHPVPADYADAKRGSDAAQQALDAARAALQSAHTAQVRAKAALDASRDQRTRLDGALAAEPDMARARAGLDAAMRAQQAWTQARTAVGAAREHHRGAAAALDRLAAEIQAAHRGLAAARDPLVVLGAPAVGGTDLAADWAALSSWARTARADREAALSEVDAALAAAAADRDGVLAAVRASFAAAGVAAPSVCSPQGLTAAVVEALGEAKAALAGVRERRRQARSLAQEEKEVRTAAESAGALAMLLDARHFEKWLCSEALALLVEDAGATLRELSAGQYELALTGTGDIEVIDHNDAGTRRPVRTLSGGETFQASLALALALSQHVASMAASATRNLETILLDEGFGTLDASTLDVVASTLEKLACGGERTVGIVTHVPQLAERVPVQFRVSRNGATSSLEKVTL